MSTHTNENNHQNTQKEDEESPVPDIKNSKRSIRFLSSFQALEEDKIEKMASKTPEERIRNITHLLKMVYHDSLKTASKDRSIKFK